jgi:hypothetical protein
MGSIWKWAMSAGGYRLAKLVPLSALFIRSLGGFPITGDFSRSDFQTIDNRVRNPLWSKRKYLKNAFGHDHDVLFDAVHPSAGQEALDGFVQGGG